MKWVLFSCSQLNTSNNLWVRALIIFRCKTMSSYIVRRRIAVTYIHIYKLSLEFSVASCDAVAYLFSACNLARSRMKRNHHNYKCIAPFVFNFLFRFWFSILSTLHCNINVFTNCDINLVFGFAFEYLHSLQYKFILDNNRRVSIYALAQICKSCGVLIKLLASIRRC